MWFHRLEGERGRQGERREGGREGERREGGREGRREEGREELEHVWHPMEPDSYTNTCWQSGWNLPIWYLLHPSTPGSDSFTFPFMVLPAPMI